MSFKWISSDLLQRSAFYSVQGYLGHEMCTKVSIIRSDTQMTLSFIKGGYRKIIIYPHYF